MPTQWSKPPEMAIDPKMSYEDAAALILKKIRELEKIH